MDEIIALAVELGRKINAHERCVAFTSAARDVASDRDAQQILRDYQEHADRLAQLQERQQPIEPKDKQRMAELEGRIAGHSKLKTLMRTQADYLELMNRVQSAIDGGPQS